MIVGIQDEILRLHSIGLLRRLLADKTTKANILWAADAYREKGPAYQRGEEITADLITGEHSGVIKNRARKAMEQQFERTRQRGEVFTPLWVCQRMNDLADEVWFGREGAFAKGGQPTDRVVFPETRTWQQYVDDRRLEITCGEAPYLVSRYDVSTGERIPIEHRIGLLDRKLRVVSENAADEDEWMIWAIRAFQATYGYEFQGDNLLIARVNLLMTFEDYLMARWKRRPTGKEYQVIANIIAWNLWQMDGLTGAIPYDKAQKKYREMSLFVPSESEDECEGDRQPPCRIYDWRGKRSLLYRNVNTGGRTMKFDFVIGNPPYQEETEGTSDKPIYNIFMDAAYKVGSKVELITPARFLFNAGKTPKTWNEKMLNDPHLKVLFHEQDSSKVFNNTDIKGGVAITYRNESQNYGAIGAYSPFPELNSIKRKVTSHHDFATLDDEIVSQNRWNLNALYEDYPDMRNKIGSAGKERRLTTSIFTTINIFREEKTDSDLEILGLINNKRIYRYVSKKYIDSNHDNLYKWKVILPASNGSGAIGEVLSTPLCGTPLCGTPLCGTPLCGYTQSFIGIGSFDNENDTNACLKYIKTKFARTCLGILKITQHNHKGTWKYVPLQDFTPSSDIDWSKSISEIDQQLYKKYGLDEKEIDFIESHVKEMK